VFWKSTGKRYGKMFYYVLYPAFWLDHFSWLLTGWWYKTFSVLFSSTFSNYNVWNISYLLFSSTWTHVDSSQTCSCGVCGKEFSRADNRKRHEAAHSYSLTCGVCGQYFNRLDSLARHRVHHERPEAKQRLPMKRPPTGTGLWRIYMGLHMT
jgi:transcription elongation factor Elf1